MSPLTRYLVFGVLRKSVAALVLLLCIYTLFDLVELRSTTGLSSIHLLTQYLLKIPTVLSQLLPLSVTVGLSLTIVTLRAHGEWEAMAVAGLSPLSISLKLLTPTLGAALTVYGLTGFVAPLSLSQADSDAGAQSTSRVESHWIRSENDMVKLDDNGHILTSIGLGVNGEPVYHAKPNPDPTSPGSWVCWRAGAGWRVAKDLETRHIPRDAIPRDADVGDPSPLGTLPGATLTSPALSAVIDRRSAAALDAAPLKAERALRWVMVVSALLIPLSTFWFNHFSKRTSGAGQVGQGVLLTALYWLVAAILWNGAAGHLWSEAWLAWGAPFLYGILAATGFVALHWRRLPARG